MFQESGFGQFEDKKKGLPEEVVDTPAPEKFKEIQLTDEQKEDLAEEVRRVQSQE